MSTEITRFEGDDSEDFGLADRQVAALEALGKLGAAPRGEGEAYSPDRRVRAQQLIYEGRLGGPGRGQGRRRQARASETVAEYVRETLTPKIQKALKDGLHEGEDLTIRLKTADMALKVEREEAQLQLREEQSDLDNASKEQLIAAIIALTSDSETQAALEGAVIDLPESAVTEVPPREDNNNGNGGRTPEPEAAGAAVGSSGNGATSVPEATGADTGEAGSNGTGDPEASGSQRPNPFKQAARRRATNRRRAS